MTFVVLSIDPHPICVGAIVATLRKPGADDEPGPLPVALVTGNPTMVATLAVGRIVEIYIRDR